MRLGISSYTYGWAIGVDGDRPTGAPTALDLVDRAAAMGVGVLQVADNLPSDTYSDANVARLRQHADARGVRLELGARGCRPPHLRRFIGHAAALGSRVLRIVLDDRDDHPDVDAVVARLTEVRPDLETTGVTLAVENHDRFKAAALAHIVRALGTRRVGICLDTVNSFGALEGPEVVVATLGPHVVNVHVKDFAVRRVPYLQGFVVEGRPAGAGMLDVPWLLSRLATFGVDCNAIAELWVPPEPTPAATIEKEAQWAAQSVRALRQWIRS